MTAGLLIAIVCVPFFIYMVPKFIRTEIEIKKTQAKIEAHMEEAILNNEVKIKTDVLEGLRHSDAGKRINLS